MAIELQAPGMIGVYQSPMVYPPIKEPLVVTWSYTCPECGAPYELSIPADEEEIEWATEGFTKFINEHYEAGHLVGACGC